MRACGGGERKRNPPGQIGSKLICNGIRKIGIDQNAATAGVQEGAYLPEKLNCCFQYGFPAGTCADQYPAPMRTALLRTSKSW